MHLMMRIALVTSIAPSLAAGKEAAEDRADNASYVGARPSERQHNWRYRTPGILRSPPVRVPARGGSLHVARRAWARPPHRAMPLS